MTYDQISENLSRFNEWRRGGDGEQPDPTEVGEAIEAALDALTTLERERDEARDNIARLCEHFRAQGIVDLGVKLLRLERERDEAREALREMLKMVPRPSCDLFHHSKKDRHNYDEPCPLVERYRSKIKRAEEVAK